MEQGVASEDVLSHLPSRTDGLRRRLVRSFPRAARSSSWRPSGPSSRTPSGSPAPLVPELAAAPRAASCKPSLPDLTRLGGGAWRGGAWSVRGPSGRGGAARGRVAPD